MKGKFIVLTGCILCLMAGCGKDTPSYYELGAEELEGKNYQSAIENFELAIAEEEYEVEALRGEGIAYLKMGRYEEAQQALEKARDLAADSEKAMRADILAYLAVVKYQRGDFEGSAAACDQMLEVKNSKEGYFLRGTAYLHLDQYDKAASDFGKVAADSKEYNDYLEIYRVYEECDMKADGESYLEMALEIEGSDEQDHYDRGRVYYYLEEYDEAKKELTTSYNAGYKKAAIYLGKVYAEQGDTANARANYKESLSEQSLQAKAYNGMAYCDILDGDYDSALSNIQKGLDIGDQDEKQALLFNEIVAYEKKMDYASAKEKITAYLEAYPTDERAVKENYFLETR